MLQKIVFLILVITVTSCGGKKPAEVPASISEKGNSVYYYLVTQLEEMKGNESGSVFYLDKSIKRNPRSSYLVLQKAYHLAQANKLDSALHLVKQALKKNPDDQEAILLEGKIYTAQQKSQAAISRYQRAIHLEPNNLEAHGLLAREYLVSENYPLAALAVTRAIQLEPESLPLYLLLGEIQARQKKYSQAQKTYEEALVFFPDEPKLLHLVAELQLAQKKYAKALETLLTLKELNQADLNTNVRVGLLYYELKQLDYAIKVFEDILEKYPDSDRIHYYLGLLSQEKEEYPKALDHLKAIPFGSQFYNEALLRHAIILRLQDKVELAISLLQTAITKRPKVVDFYDLLSSLIAIKEDYGAALEVLDRGLRQNPKDERLLFAKGVLFEKMGNTEKALELMQQVLAVNDKNALALNFIGYSYVEKNSHMDEAKNLLERALKLQPEDGFITDSLGWYYYQTGEDALALQFLRKANRLSPKEPTILEHLGDLYLKKANKLKARDFFEQSLFELKKKKDPNQKILEQIHRIEEKMSRF